MHKNILLLLLAIGISLSAAAQSGLIDKVVAVVGKEMILLSDVESEIYMRNLRGTTASANDLRCEVFEELLLQKLLLAQARVDSLAVSDNMVDEQIEHRMREIIMQLGSEKAVEAYFRKPLFQLRKDFRETVREQLLTRQMQSTLMQDIPITPSEVEQAYKKMSKDSLPIIPTQYVLRQIIINPPASEAKFAVRERLLEIRDRIAKGEKFSTLAILYSEDQSNAMRGGELGLRHKQEYASAFADAAMALKPGQVSPIVETEFGYHLIEMIEKDGAEMFNARHILMKPKYTSTERTAAYQKLDSIAEVVRNGEMSFEKAAMKLSEDTKSNASGGLIVNEMNLSSHFEKDQLNPADYAALRDLKQGDISIPYESQDRLGNTQYKIIYLEKLIPSHTANVQDDYSVIQQLAKQQRQLAAFEKWIKQKQAATYIRIDSQLHHCAFGRNGWVK